MPPPGTLEKIKKLLSPKGIKERRLINRLLDEIDEVEPLKGSWDFAAEIGEFIIKLEPMPGDILEIGTFRGKTAIFCAKLLENIGSNKWVVTIDPYIEYFPESEITRTLGKINKKGATMKAEYDRFLANLERLSVTRHKKHYLMRSSEAFNELKNSRFSFIYIDGEHTEEAVLNDFNLYSRCLSPGGVIAFDDVFNTVFPGVGVAVRSLIESNRISVIRKSYRGIFAELT